MANKAMQQQSNESNSNETMSTTEKIARLESEIEAKRAEIDQLLDESVTQSESALHEESSFVGEIIVIGDDAPPDMICSPSRKSASDEASVGQRDVASNPASPRSSGGLFDHLLRPSGKAETGKYPNPRTPGGLFDLTIPSLDSSGSQTEFSVSETQLLKKEIEDRDRKIEMLQDFSEQMFEALGSRVSSLEDEVEGLRAENTKLRSGSKERHTPSDPPHMIRLSYCESESDKTSACRMEVNSNPACPRSSGGLFKHLLRPFKAETSRPPSALPPSGHADDLTTCPSSPGSQTESASEIELLKREVDDRELRIEKLEESAKRSERTSEALGSRISSLEDEVEGLRVENTKLRIGSRMIEEEKRKVAGEMRTEMELLHLETRWSARKSRSPPAA